MKTLYNFFYDLFFRRYIPYYNATFLPKKKEIRISKRYFLGLLKDWDFLSEEQKKKQWEILNYHFNKEGD